MAHPTKKEDDKCVKASISFEPEDMRRLLNYCQKEERSMSWVIRKALREWLDNNEN